mmetsp:Transcript_8226/g.21215  ORF Transcript_8226/g.21215 Transcript_8226/m.21215 type:complete len:359 (+) Transcript_8226:782-1858(+)
MYCMCGGGGGGIITPCGWCMPSPGMYPYDGIMDTCCGGGGGGGGSGGGGGVPVALGVPQPHQQQAHHQPRSQYGPAPVYPPQHQHHHTTRHPGGAPAHQQRYRQHHHGHQPPPQPKPNSARVYGGGARREQQHQHVDDGASHMYYDGGPYYAGGAPLHPDPHGHGHPYPPYSLELGSAAHGGEPLGAGGTGAPPPPLPGGAGIFGDGVGALPATDAELMGIQQADLIQLQQLLGDGFSGLDENGQLGPLPELVDEGAEYGMHHSGQHGAPALPSDAPQLDRAMSAPAGACAVCAVRARNQRGCARGGTHRTSLRARTLPRAPAPPHRPAFLPALLVGNRARSGAPHVHVRASQAARTE